LVIVPLKPQNSKKNFIKFGYSSFETPEQQETASKFGYSSFETPEQQETASKFDQISL
jgi:hypothetical protein